MYGSSYVFERWRLGWFGRECLKWLPGRYLPWCCVVYKYSYNYWSIQGHRSTTAHNHSAQLLRTQDDTRSWSYYMGRTQLVRLYWTFKSGRIRHCRYTTFWYILAACGLIIERNLCLIRRTEPHDSMWMYFESRHGLVPFVVAMFLNTNHYFTFAASRSW